MITHKHDLAPADYGGVYCMSCCELDLDADEMAAAFQALLAACEAYEEWEADIILNADWRSELPRISQAQWDRLVEIQAMRNAAIAQAKGEE